MITWLTTTREENPRHTIHESEVKMIREVISSLREALGKSSVEIEDRIARIQFIDDRRAVIEFECKDMQLVKVYGTDMSVVNGGFKAFETEEHIYRGIRIDTLLMLFDSANIPMVDYTIVEC